jgi:hypothetical protein
MLTYRSGMDPTKTAASEYWLLEAIKVVIKQKKGILGKMYWKVIDIVDRLRDFEIAFLYTASNNPDVTHSALKKINTSELGHFISGAVLAFYSILALTNSRTYSTEKLFKLLNIANDNIDIAEAFVNSIGDLGEYSKSSNRPVEDNIGIIRDNGFKIDVSKLQTGKRYKINYDLSQYEFEKNDNGDLILYEVG